MKLFALLFVAGCALVQQLAALPSAWWLPVVVAPLLVLRGKFRGAAGLSLGLAWALGYAIVTRPADLPIDDVRTNWLATGTIEELPVQGDGKSRFLLRAQQLAANGENFTGNWRLRLTWRHQRAKPPPALQPGQVWRLPLRLKPARGYRNPGSWDYAGWLYRQGVRYAGYVRTVAAIPAGSENAPALLDTASCCLIDRWRQQQSDRLQGLDLSADASGIFRALTLGDRAGLDHELKTVFQQTGTSHLMAISGLHIGLVSGLLFFATNYIWRRIPVLCRRTPAMVAASIAALLGGLAYALVSGFALPAQRALLMLLTAVIVLVYRRRADPWNVLALAAVVVLARRPDAVIEAGFWLSFVAVGAIIATTRLLQSKPWWWQAVGVQLGINLALYPVLLLFGLNGSLLAPLTNLLLVPLFGFVIVPGALVGLVLLNLASAAGKWVIGWLGAALDIIVAGLQMVATAGPALGVALYWPASLLLLLVVGTMIVLAPRGLAPRPLGILLLFAAHLPRAPQIDDGAFEFTLLDVGQGLSAVIRTHDHTLVYDTGPAFPSGFNTGDRVGLPFLRQAGVSRLDRLILSHGDNDHDGGAASIVEGIPVGRVTAGEPSRTTVDSQPCRAGQQWHWNGVSFRFLHPAQETSFSGNNASCVLRIDNAAGGLLLTGDIERSVERRLTGEGAGFGNLRVVVAGHHGSRTSSSQTFVDATSPDYVLYAAGAFNQWGFPVAEVRERWQQAGATALRTDADGAIRFVFRADGTFSEPVTYRMERARYWWD